MIFVLKIEGEKSETSCTFSTANSFLYWKRNLCFLLSVSLSASSEFKREKVLLNKSFLSSSLDRVYMGSTKMRTVQVVGLGRHLWHNFVAKRRTVPPTRTLPAKLLRHSNKLTVCLSVHSFDSVMHLYVGISACRIKI